MSVKSLIWEEWKRKGYPIMPLIIEVIERRWEEDYDLFRIKTAISASGRTVGFAAIRGGRVVRFDVLGYSDLFPTLLRVVDSQRNEVGR